MEAADAVDRQLMYKIAKIMDEARASQAVHNRKIKELIAIRSKSASIHQFSMAFTRTLTPIFHAQSRTSSIERSVRFISTFASARDSNSDEFLEKLLKFLLVGVVAANRTARFRACQIISEIILRLPDDAEVSTELWDEVLECMKVRVLDKVPVIRNFAIRALSRFVNDTENVDILDLLLDRLPLEQNGEVRKTIVLSLPPSIATSQAIIDCTLDASESVRKATYCVLANKFPLQSLSIKLRTVILQRGLGDRSAAVSKECLKLLTDQWLSNCCKGNPIELLKYLDVETYESVGESVMEALLNADLVKVRDGESIRHYIASACDESEGETANSTPSIQLVEAEAALYWRTLCRHLQKKAQAKGSDAATTMGTEAAVYAAEASDSNDLLEHILPATVSDYVALVKAHINAGPNHRFAARQLLLLGEMLDFSDATISKVASSFLKYLLQRPLEHEVDEDGNKIIIGDGINLGGDKEWADAVSRLARKVHSSAGEFEEVVLGIVQEIAKPCRERAADFTQWMHALAVSGLLLENAKSLSWIQGKATQPDEILHALLLPGAKHIHVDVQRVAIRGLGLFGLLQSKPSGELIKQLRLSFIKSSPPISIMASKALMDLGMWHGPQEVDNAMGQDLISQPETDSMSSNFMNFPDADGDPNTKILDLLYAGLETDKWSNSVETIENESVKAILAEGFAKFLLLSKKYPSMPVYFRPLLLTRLINLYFREEAKELHRLKQCLSVFFEHYASLSLNHKGYLSKAFIPVMRSMWPGINGNPGGSTIAVSNMRKRAVQASKFMLQMMQAPLYGQENEGEEKTDGNDIPETMDGSVQPSLDCSEGGLAIRIATEVASFQAKKTAAEKAYVAALCRVLVTLHFHASEQVAIKVMRRILSCVAESVSAEKDLLKELKLMAERLKVADAHLDQELLQDEAKLIFEKLGLDFDLDTDGPIAVPQTPVPCSTKPTRPRRRARREERSSDEEDSPTSAQSFVPPSTIAARSHRASKTAALIKMTTTVPVEIDEDDEEGSVVESESESEDSDESDPLTE